MKSIKSTLGLALILYLCASLSGAPLVLTASAKIVPKDVNEPTKFYLVKKNDTLWKLAKQYRSNGRLWRDFEKYNIFTNANLIYPYEELQVPESWALPGTPRQAKPIPPVAQARQTNLVIEDSVTKSEFDTFKREFDRYKGELNASLGDLKNQIDELRRQNQILRDSIAELQNSTQSNAEAIRQLQLAVEANEAKISRLTQQVAALEKGLADNTSELRKWRERLDGVNAQVEALAGEVDEIKKTQNDILAQLAKLLEREDPPEPSKKTRTIAIVTAVAGGVAWLAVNAIGRGD